MNLNADAIYGFATSLLSKRFDNPQPTPAFHYEMWQYCCDPHPFVAIAAPRGHAKSTAVTHSFVLASVLFRESSYAIILSDTEGQVVQFLNDIKMELMENEDLRHLFQVRKFVKETETDLIVELGPDGHKFRIQARAAGTSLRGLKWRGKRPDLIVGDDLENDESVMNEDRRAKFRQWFYGALVPALSDKGKIRLVGTILHFDSLLERLMPSTTGEDTQYTIRKGLRDWSVKPEPEWKSVKYRSHTDFDDFSEVLWPEKFDQKRLQRLRNDYVRQGYPEGYSQEYLNYPLAEGSAFFRRQDFIKMEEEDFEKPKHFYAGVDLAVSERDKRSYSVIVVAGMDSEGYLHIVEVVRERLDPKELIDEMMNLQIKYRMEIWFIEDGALKKSIGPFLQNEMMKKGNPFLNIIAKPPVTDKESRARAIQGRMRQGTVKVDHDAEWFPAFQEELLRFNRGAYNDQVDALAWIGVGLNEMQESPSEDELEELAWEEEYEHSQLFDYGSAHSGPGGVSKYTGY